MAFSAIWMPLVWASAIRLRRLSRHLSKSTIRPICAWSEADASPPGCDNSTAQHVCGGPQAIEKPRRKRHGSRDMAQETWLKRHGWSRLNGRDGDRRVPPQFPVDEQFWQMINLRF